MGRRGWGIGLAAVIVVALLALWSFRGGDDEPPPQPVEEQTAGTDDRGLIRAAPIQRGTPSAVTLARVALPRDGYAAVYATADGAPGQRLGATPLLDAGDHLDVDVPLADPLEGPADLVVILHEEGDGDTTLDFPDADPPLDGDGGVITLGIALDPEP